MKRALGVVLALGAFVLMPLRRQVPARVAVVVLAGCAGLGALAGSRSMEGSSNTFQNVSKWDSAPKSEQEAARRLAALAALDRPAGKVAP